MAAVKVSMNNEHIHLRSALYFDAIETFVMSSLSENESSCNIMNKIFWNNQRTPFSDTFASLLSSLTHWLSVHGAHWKFLGAIDDDTICFIPLITPQKRPNSPNHYYNSCRQKLLLQSKHKTTHSFIIDKKKITELFPCFVYTRICCSLPSPSVPKIVDQIYNQKFIMIILKAD